MLFISLTCHIYVELHTIYRIKIHQIVLELQAFDCKSPFSKITSACATDLKQEPYGHLTTASVIIDRFNMVSVGKT